MPLEPTAPSAGERLQAVRESIQQALQRYHRPSDSVALLAVSKTKSAEAVAAVAAAGQQRFGENYLQEALEKMEVLRPLGLEWHFIGPIQSNKTRGIAEHFAWVHSVDRLRIARRLSEQRPAELPPLNVCLQINIDAEPSKSGIALDQLAATAVAIAKLPRLTLRGLMAIPFARSELAEQRRPFRRLRQAAEQVTALGIDLDTLSMGMSGDLEAAIAEGATLVRVGTALFGPRA